MHIAGIFLNSEIRTGGHRRYLQLLSGLSLKGHEVKLLTRKGSNITSGGSVQIESVVVNEWPNRSVGFFWGLYKNRKLVKNFTSQCEAVIIFGETHLVSGLYLAKLNKARLFFSFRSNAIRENLTYLKYENLSIIRRVKYWGGIIKYWIYEEIIAAKSELIVVQSTYDSEDIKKRHKHLKTPIVIIGGNYDTERFIDKYRLRNKSTSLKSILFVGSINRRKGIFYLLEAFLNILAEDRKDLVLVVIGFGPMETELKKRINNSEYEENIRFIGRVKNPFEYIVESDLVVVPSLFDSYPNVVLEAVFTGTPVLGSRVGGIPEMLECNELLFEPGSVKEIRDKIERILESTEYYEMIKKMVLQRNDKFDFDWVERFEKEFEAVL